MRIGVRPSCQLALSTLPVYPLPLCSVASLPTPTWRQTAALQSSNLKRAGPLRLPLTLTPLLPPDPPASSILRRWLRCRAATQAGWCLCLEQWWEK